MVLVTFVGLSLISLCAWMIWGHLRDQRLAGRRQPEYDDEAETDPMIEFRNPFQEAVSVPYPGDLRPAMVYVQSKIGLVELVVTGEGTNALVKMTVEQARMFAARVARESSDAEEMLRRTN